jgi:hypothetical protein
MVLCSGHGSLKLRCELRRAESGGLRVRIRAERPNAAEAGMRAPCDLTVPGDRSELVESALLFLGTVSRSRLREAGAAPLPPGSALGDRWEDVEAGAMPPGSALGDRSEDVEAGAMPPGSALGDRSEDVEAEALPPGTGSGNCLEEMESGLLPPGSASGDPWEEVELAPLPAGTAVRARAFCDVILSSGLGHPGTHACMIAGHFVLAEGSPRR